MSAQTEQIRRDMQPRTVVRDEALPHQVKLEWATAGKQEVRTSCNCGWTDPVLRRPEALGSVQAAIASYEGHLVR